jgi:predicted metal-dependent enzyme (double-stranded beta helix superfamily)
MWNMAVNLDPIRTAAANMHALLAGDADDPTKDPEALAAALAPLVGAHEALFDIAHQRPTQLKRSKLAYFDPGLTILVSAFGPEFREPIHNHGLWNVLLICTGSMSFRGYRRLDDCSREGYAEISLVEDKIVTAGQIGAVGPPPHDIHALDVLEEDTWLITVSPGDAVNVRQIYDPEDNSYTLQTLADANTQHVAALD